jgi:hypothetical protein
MLKLNCETGNAAMLTEMTPFQGDLKVSNDKEIAVLAESLLTDGLNMPIALWAHDDRYLILDGHQRYRALIALSLNDPSILSQNLPVVLVKADTEDEARKIVLQSISQYGKITRKGLSGFITPAIADYKAPVLGKVVRVKPQVSDSARPVRDMKATVRLRAPRDILPRLLELLRQVEGVEIV